MYGNASERTLALEAGVWGESLIGARMLSADCTVEERKRRPHEGRLSLVRVTGYWIVSCFAAAAAFFGSVSSSTPSAYLALARDSSISSASLKARATFPT